MTGKVINLNKARKTRKREDSRQVADENAVKFGQTKGARAKIKSEMQRRSKNIDDSKLED